MSVHVVAILAADVRLSVGDVVPDGVGAWVESFSRVREANHWLTDAYRSRYYVGDSEATIVFANSEGRVIRCPRIK